MTAISGFAHFVTVKRYQDFVRAKTEHISLDDFTWLKHRGRVGSHIAIVVMGRSKLEPLVFKVTQVSPIPRQGFVFLDLEKVA